jgi:hypothetical protein
LQGREPDRENDVVLRAFEFVPGHVAERLQNPGRRRGRRPSSFGKDRQTVDPAAGHGLTDRPLDERVHHHRQEGRVNQPRGPLRFFEVDRRDPEFGLEEGMTLLDIGLVLVDKKDLFAGGLLQVRDQGKHTVGPGLGPQGGLVARDRQGQAAESDLPQRSARPRTASAVMAGSPDLPAVQADLQEPRTPAAAEDDGDLLADDGPLLAFAAVEFGGEIMKIPLGFAHLGLPGCRVQGRLLGTPAPDDPMAFACFRDSVDRGPVDVRRIVFFPPVLDGQSPAPAHRSPLPQQVPHRLVLGPGAGQDGDELAPVAVQIGQVLAGAELAVGHVDEVVAAQKLPQTLQVSPVDRVVAPVPAVDLVGDRHRAVGRDVEAKDQLFEVRPVALVETESDPWFLDAPLVAAVEGDRGRVVVDAAGVELELFDDLDRQVEKQTFSLGRGEGVQGPGDPVVVERALLRFGEPETFGPDGLGPLGDAVKRSRREKNVLDQNAQSLGVVEEAFSRPAEAGGDDRGKRHLGQKMAKDGMGTEEMDLERSGADGSLNFSFTARLSRIHNYDIYIREQWRRQVKCHDCSGSAAA